MSHPKRFSVAVDDPWFGDGAYITEEGKYVLWSDYSALAAENERLRKDIMEISKAAKMVSEIGIKAADELTMLKDQNERLLKAGDEMKSWIICEGYDLHCVDDWLAAKEGGAK